METLVYPRSGSVILGSRSDSQLLDVSVSWVWQPGYWKVVAITGNSVPSLSPPTSLQADQVAPSTILQQPHIGPRRAEWLLVQVPATLFSSFPPSALRSPWRTGCCHPSCPSKGHGSPLKHEEPCLLPSSSSQLPISYSSSTPASLLETSPIPVCTH